MKCRFSYYLEGLVPDRVRDAPYFDGDIPYLDGDVPNLEGELPDLTEPFGDILPFRA